VSKCAGAAQVYLASAGEFDPLSGTFTYAGGNCREELNGSLITVTHTASLVVLMLPAGFVLRKDALCSAPAVCTALNGTLTLAHPELMGDDCAWDATLFSDRCSRKTNTSSSKSFAVGGCLGNQQTGKCMPVSAALGRADCHADAGTHRWR
jgi:hypothetical protein